MMQIPSNPIVNYPIDKVAVYVNTNDRFVAITALGNEDLRDMAPIMESVNLVNGFNLKTDILGTFEMEVT